VSHKEVEIDIYDGHQRRGDRYGREVGIVYCDRINVNKASMENKLARIYTEYCSISEFKNENGFNLIVNLCTLFFLLLND
jgi:endonuclease YncB( thermonuclease family)